jgi:hypothetical protein
MAQGRSTQVISMIKWIRTSRLSIKKSLSGRGRARLRLGLSMRASGYMGRHTAKVNHPFTSEVNQIEDVAYEPFSGNFRLSFEPLGPKTSLSCLKRASRITRFESASWGGFVCVWD